MQPRDEQVTYAVAPLHVVQLGMDPVELPFHIRIPEPGQPQRRIVESAAADPAASGQVLQIAGVDQAYVRPAGRNLPSAPAHNAAPRSGEREEIGVWNHLAQRGG